jgi:hypothetical protein
MSVHSWKARRRTGTTLRAILIEEVLSEADSDLCQAVNLYTFRGLMDFLASGDDAAVAESLGVPPARVATIRDRAEQFAAAYEAGTRRDDESA